MDDENGKDRRQHPRHALTFDLQGAETGNDHVTARMVANNLSLGGLYCTSPIDYPEMTRLAVRLLLPLDDNGGARPVDIEAVVVRREEIRRGSNGDARFNLALFFPKLAPATRVHLERFLEGQSPETILH